MHPLKRTVLLICFTVCLSIGYLVNQNVEIETHVRTSIIDHSTSRINFLNNTFCGKFISGTWSRDINATEIMKRKQLLRQQIKLSPFEYKNLTCTEFVTKNGFYSKHITDLGI